MSAVASILHLRLRLRCFYTAVLCICILTIMITHRTQHTPPIIHPSTQHTPYNHHQSSELEARTFDSVSAQHQRVTRHSQPTCFIIHQTIKDGRSGRGEETDSEQHLPSRARRATHGNEGQGRSSRESISQHGIPVQQAYFHPHRNSAPLIVPPILLPTNP